MEKLVQEFSKDSKFMQEKFKFKYKSSQCILYKYYYGPTTMEDIRFSWEQAFENNLIPKETKGFILDYRNASFEMEIDEHEGIANFYKKNIDKFRNKKIAIISEKPRDIAIVILVESKDDGYISKPFSTVEAAIAWILSYHI